MAGILQQAMLTWSGDRAHCPCEKWKSPLEKYFQSTLRGGAEWCRPTVCLYLASLVLPLGVPVSSCALAPLWVFEGTVGFPQLMTQ